MQRRRRPRAWTNALMAIASLALGAPLAMAAIDRMAMLFPRSPEPGYLLYPRLGLCTPTREQTAEALLRRPPCPFRPMRTANAVMPPGLGQSLSPQWLVTHPDIPATRGRQRLARPLGE